jgi:bacterioferritin (cytochrome b1)
MMKDDAAVLDRPEPERAENESSADRTAIRRMPGPPPTSSAIVLLTQALALANRDIERSKRQYQMGLRYHSPQLAAAALVHANEARIHAHRIIERIVALGEKPDPMAGEGFTRASRQRKSASLDAVVRGELRDSDAAIDRYRKIAAYFATADRDTAELMKGIVADEEACASELAGVLDHDDAQSTGNCASAAPVH